MIAAALTLFLCLYCLCSDRKRLQDREELWLRLEQQAADNYANLAAQGDVVAPPPLMPFTPVDSVPPPLGKHAPGKVRILLFFGFSD